MISDLSFLCSTVTFADPPTLQDHRGRTRHGAEGMCAFFEKSGARRNVRLAEFMHVCVFLKPATGVDGVTRGLVDRAIKTHQDSRAISTC